MKTLIVGAGALGGYFGGRLLDAGRDVTFLVRSRRREQLRRTGLVIRSHFGDLLLPSPPTVLAEEIDCHYDLIIVACKAYDLESTMSSFDPAVGPETFILPLLNGLRHVRILGDRFGEQAVLGGQCVISASLDEDGRVIHHNDLHSISFGNLQGSRHRIDRVASELTEAGFDAIASETILQEMWEKWVFIAAAASLTTLMRATVGDIVEAGGSDFARTLYAEASTVAKAWGYEPRKAVTDRSLCILTSSGSPFTASMLKDIERGSRTEAEQIVGDLIRSAPESAGELPMLNLALLGLRAHEAKLRRSQAA